MVSMAWRGCGFVLTCQIASSTSELVPAYRRWSGLSSGCDMVFHRDLSLARYCFCYTLPILPSWSSCTVFMSICKLMILKYTTSVRRHQLISCSFACRPVSTTFLFGCHLIGYSLTPPRQSYCGAHRHGDSFSCLPHLSEHATTM